MVVVGVAATIRYVSRHDGLLPEGLFEARSTPVKRCAPQPLRPFDLPSRKGLNYGGPILPHGEYLGLEWLRSGTHNGDYWDRVRPELEDDLDFISRNDLGRVHRIFIGLDQLMVWNDRTGFVRFHEQSLSNFGTALGMFERRGMKVFVVLYDQEEQESRGNFRFKALDGHHPEMRKGYLRAADAFLRRYGSSKAVVGWDLFNEAYNSLGRDGGLPKPPHADPVSPNYSNQRIHGFLRDLYAVAHCAAPDAWFTVSDTTALYPTQGDLSLYQDVVDFYDIHIYDDKPKLRNWGSELGKPVIAGEVGAFLENDHIQDQAINSRVVDLVLKKACQSGLQLVLAQPENGNIFPPDRSKLTETGRVIQRYKGC